jgi:hypothetical protein
VVHEEGTSMKLIWGWVSVVVLLGGCVEIQEEAGPDDPVEVPECEMDVIAVAISQSEPAGVSPDDAMEFLGEQFPTTLTWADGSSVAVVITMGLATYQPDNVFIDYEPEEACLEPYQSDHLSLDTWASITTEDGAPLLSFHSGKTSVWGLEAAPDLLGYSRARSNVESLEDYQPLLDDQGSDLHSLYFIATLEEQGITGELYEEVVEYSHSHGMPDETESTPVASW